MVLEKECYVDHSQPNSLVMVMAIAGLLTHVTGGMILIEQKVVQIFQQVIAVVQMQDVDGNHPDSKYKIVALFVKTIQEL